MGGASRWWLHHSLASLDADLRKLGSRLILRRGNVVRFLRELAQETGASAVHCIRHYEPWWRNAERALGEKVNLVRHDGNYLMPPGSVKTGSGGPFKIYTPFWRALCAANAAAMSHWPRLRGSMLQTNGRKRQAGRMEIAPDQTRLGRRHGRYVDARARQARTSGSMTFTDRAQRYDEDRNFPSIAGTSFLSPHLHFGEISPATCWHADDESGRIGRDVFERTGLARLCAECDLRSFPIMAAKMRARLRQTAVARHG